MQASEKKKVCIKKLIQKRNKRKKKNCAAPHADNMNEREVEWMAWPFSWLRIWHGLSTSTELSSIPPAQARSLFFLFLFLPWGFLYHDTPLLPPH